MTSDQSVPRQLSPKPVTGGEADDEIDLMALIGTLWRGKWWIALITTAALLVGGYYAYRVAVPKYTSTAVVVLDSRRQSVVDLTSVMSGLSGDQASINTEVAVLHSRNLAVKLVRALDLTKDPEFNVSLLPKSRYDPKTLVKRLLGLNKVVPTPTANAILEATVDRVLKAIAISNKRQSYVFDIKVVTTSPEKSARIANKLADLYILDQLDVKFEATQKATKWLTGRVAELKVKLERSAAKVKNFNSGIDLVSPAALVALNVRLKDLRDRVANAKTAASRLAARVEALKTAQQSAVPEKMATAADDRTLTQMLQLLQAGTVLRASFDGRFAQLLTRAGLELDRANSQTNALENSVTALEAQIERQSKDLLTLQQLQREAAANQQIYEYFLTRLKETSVQQGIQQADSRVLSTAVIPGVASAPRKTLIMVLAAMLGLLASSGLVLWREMMQNTFRTAEDLEGFSGYTVMGQIPQIPARQRGGVLDYILKKPTSRAAEAVRNLRTSILLSNVDDPPKVVMSTSSLPREGKTTQAVMLAQNMAAIGKKVLLVEGDIRRRVFSVYFGISQNKGLVSVLAGDASFEDVVTHDQRMQLDILIGEKPNINAADLFSSERFAVFVKEMRQRYDFVVIDTPPVLVVPDARVIAQFVDAIIYTVKWDSTSKAQLRQGLAMFESVGRKVTGLVLSQINPRGMRHYGYHRYGAYGYHSRGYYEN